MGSVSLQGFSYAGPSTVMLRLPFPLLLWYHCTFVSWVRSTSRIFLCRTIDCNACSNFEFLEVAFHWGFVRMGGGIAPWSVLDGIRCLRQISSCTYSFSLFFVLDTTQDVESCVTTWSGVFAFGCTLCQIVFAEMTTIGGIFPVTSTRIHLKIDISQFH